MPFPRASPNACLIGNKIYVCEGAHVIEGNPVVFDSLHIFDIPTNSWERGQPLLAARSYFGADTIDGKIYLAGGGTDGWNMVKNLYVYDPEVDEWTEKASMNSSRWTPCARSWNGKLYIFGGYTGEIWDISKSIEVYDPDLDKWTYLSLSPTGRVAMDVWLNEDQLFVFGGYHSSSNTGYNYIEKVSRYDMTTDRWFNFHHQEDRIPEGRRYLTSAVVDDKVYLFGGGTPETNQLSQEVWSYSLKDIRQNMEIRDTVFDSESIEIDLAPYFSSTGEKELSYSVCKGYNSEIVDVYLENSILKIAWQAEEVEGTELAVNVYSTTDTVSSNSFTVKMPATTQTQFAKQDQISVYPNPASGVAVITFDISETGMATLEIYNTKGQLPEQFNLENIAADGLSFEWNVEDYNDGIYFAVLKTRRATSMSKLVIRH